MLDNFQEAFDNGGKTPAPSPVGHIVDANQMVWISVGDRLPTESGLYPAYSTNKDRVPPKDWMECFYAFDAEAKQGKSKWQHFSGFYDNGLTHWMPLPSLPKGG